MFLGHPNFSSWLTAKLLAKYGTKRFNIQDQKQQQAYISAHKIAETSEWNRPVDLKRVSFTNLSIYNTEYSVFKYLLETELDVLQKAPYNQLTVYTEIIDNEAPETFIKSIDEDRFLVGIHSGKIQQISNLLLATDVVSKILEPLTNLAKINERFLKSFAMELAVKATIYKEFSKIFNQHPAVKNSLPTNQEGIAEKYHNDLLVGEFLTTEIQSRTKAMLDSDFFDVTSDREALTTEMLQLCIATLYFYYAKQSQETNDLSAAERVFCSFNSLTEKSQNNSEAMLEVINNTHPIMEAEAIEQTLTDLKNHHEIFCNAMKA